MSQTLDMMPKTQPMASWEDQVTRWLLLFEQALSSASFETLRELFHEDCHWRDLLAATWEVKTVSGLRNILALIESFTPDTRPYGFQITQDHAAPRAVARAGVEVIEAIFCFETRVGRCFGVIRLTPPTSNTDQLKAWSLLTKLEEIKGFEEQLDRNRPSGESYSRDFKGPNWRDLRDIDVRYEERSPAVIVIGAGQAGLSIAARLRQLNVDTLVLEKNERVGDNWRNRYHTLTLHNQVQVNHLPYMPFPPTWPTYIPKDKLAGWFETYVEAMELNVWTATEVERGQYDPDKRRWSIETRSSDGRQRTLKPQHIVMATGASGIPNLPNDIQSLANFAGTTVHSEEYTHGTAWQGRKALVLGTGNSGHDIAQDLHANGAKVTMIQRSPTMVVNIEPSAQLPYALYDEGPSLEDCDLLVAATPLKVLRKTHQLVTEKAKELDKPLLDGLTKAGFALDYGTDNTGWQFKYLERGGGYYFNVGCSDLIANGQIRLIQYRDIDQFIASGVKLNHGEIIDADLLVTATGYKGQHHLVTRLFGQDVAARCGPIWGFDEENQELRNMWMRTGQPGLWFIAGSLAQCRIFSKTLALQIKAINEGLLSP
ncbi:MAG: NAD(P)/FAD-dependent oxidoreductase [Gammaproteobacteria bacterium]|nr:NAD(P)/FAD-dependent oxidoreductase [Gammaproteobacteria bacterium]